MLKAKKCKLLLIISVFTLSFFVGLNSVSANSDKSNKENVKLSKWNWNYPSQDKPYPDIAKYKNITLIANRKKHRVYIKNKNKVLYTMKASFGSKKTPTPVGKFSIEPERGENFFNSNTNEGANYWVSFKNHGEYLFHTVPTNKTGSYVENEAKHLGTKNNSHGCIRLSIPDAKWLYENIEVGTPVIVK